MTKPKNYVSPHIKSTYKWLTILTWPVTVETLDDNITNEIKKGIYCFRTEKTRNDFTSMLNQETNRDEMVAVNINNE